LLPGLVLTPNMVAQPQQPGLGGGRNTGPCFLQGLLDVLGMGQPATGHPAAFAALPAAIRFGEAVCPDTGAGAAVLLVKAAAFAETLPPATAAPCTASAGPVEAPLPAVSDPLPGSASPSAANCPGAHADLRMPACASTAGQTVVGFQDPGGEPVPELEQTLRDVDAPGLIPLPVANSPPVLDASTETPVGSTPPTSTGWDVNIEAVKAAGTAGPPPDRLSSLTDAATPAGSAGGPGEAVQAGNVAVEQVAAGASSHIPGESPSLRGQPVTLRSVVQVPSLDSPVLTPLSAVDPGQDASRVPSSPAMPPDRLPEGATVVKPHVTSSPGVETGTVKNPVAPGLNVSVPADAVLKSPALAPSGTVDAGPFAGLERPGDGYGRNAGAAAPRITDVSAGTRPGGLRSGGESPLITGRVFENTGTRGQAATPGTRPEGLLPGQEGKAERPGVPAFVVTVNAPDTPVKNVAKVAGPDGVFNTQTFASQLAGKVAKAVEKARWLPDGKAVLEIRLDPPHLGSVRVKIVYSSAQDVDVKFFAAEHGVREAVQQALPLLRDSLTRLDIHLLSGDVFLSADGERREAPADGAAARMADAPVTEALLDGTDDYFGGAPRGINLLA